jgi:hypothetical protein
MLGDILTTHEGEDAVMETIMRLQLSGADSPVHYPLFCSVLVARHIHSRHRATAQGTALIGSCYHGEGHTEAVLQSSRFFTRVL